MGTDTADGPDSNLGRLLDLLRLEQVELNIFRAPGAGVPFLFGGQVLAQALVAGARTVDSSRPPHSVHGYFLRAGDGMRPIVYDVDRIRDGRSFTTRRIVAIQDGEAIFNMSASFHVREEGIEHQFPMPDVPGPDDLPDESNRFEEMAKEMPEIRDHIPEMRWPFSQRRVEAIDPMGGEGSHPPYQHLWLKVEGDPGEDQVLHRALLAFASDMGFMSTAMLPHGAHPMNMVHGASLDHAIWFHRDIAADEWLLYQQESPSAAGARGFVRGSFFTRDGLLVASTTQECLIRVQEGGAGDMEERRKQFLEMHKRHLQSQHNNPANRGD